MFYNIESKELFSEAVKAGSVSVNMINTLIQGEAGVGKTSTKCILFNEPPPHFRTSTPLAEAPVQIRVDCSVSQGAQSHAGPRDVQVFGVKVESASLLVVRGIVWTAKSLKELLLKQSHPSTGIQTFNLIVYHPLIPDKVQLRALLFLIHAKLTIEVRLKRTQLIPLLYFIQAKLIIVQMLQKVSVSPPLKVSSRLQLPVFMDK